MKASKGKKTVQTAVRTVGRPRISDEGSIQLAIRFPASLIAKVDGIIEDRMGQTDRVSVVRELVAEALAARERRK